MLHKIRVFFSALAPKNITTIALLKWHFVVNSTRDTDCTLLRYKAVLFYAYSMATIETIFRHTGFW